MKNTKIKKANPQKEKADRIDPDHFTVFKLKVDWEKKACKYC
jgi:hypothetical protein